MNDVADEIKSCLTMEEVAIRYGFTPQRNGFINCPFHQERTASCKIYPDQGGFFCHACHVGGSVIDFTMLLFNLPFRDACARLNADFGLGLSMDKPSRAEMSRLVRQRQAEARRREALKQKELALFDRECLLTAEINRAEMAMKEHPPTRDGWNVTYPAEWVEAVKRLDGLKWELYNNDCEQDKMRADKR